MRAQMLGTYVSVSDNLHPFGFGLSRFFFKFLFVLLFVFSFALSRFVRFCFDMSCALLMWVFSS